MRKKAGITQSELAFRAGVRLLFERVLLSFLIGNGDAHLKNYSMMETDSGGLRLSPAYDIGCSKLLIPGEEDSALTINGKHNRIKRDDFFAFAEHLGIQERVRDTILNRMKRVLEIAQEDVPDSYLPAEDRQRMLDIIGERWGRIF
ncbi:MAG: HipA domain-containing protein [bacterium]